MAMNLLHRWGCRSRPWALVSRRFLLPFALDDAPLGDSVLEMGPGFGANTSYLGSHAKTVTAVEIDHALVEHLRRRYAAHERVLIVEGDATGTDLDAGDYSSVVSMAMLHHVPTADLQDALFVEARRLLAPGGVFVGGDGSPTTPFALMHINDTYNPIPPASLHDRLVHAGFVDVRVDTSPVAFRFRARTPR